MGAIWGIINCGNNADIDNRIKAINDEYARKVSLEIFINEKVTGGNRNENLDGRRAYGIRYRRDSMYK